MAMALASLLTKRPVRSNVAMTGEITLRGQVLPVGGIKEKVLAAHRVGIDTIILPSRNEKDLDDIPDDVENQIEFILVDDVDQVLAAALADPIEPLNGDEPGEDGEDVELELEVAEERELASAQSNDS
jgi:ATP-dependent Lon protease